MKKIIVLFCALFLLVSCSSTKKPLTADDYIKTMESRGLPAEDITEYYSEEGFESVIFSTPSDAEYSIAFYKSPSVENAKNDFNRFFKGLDTSYPELPYDYKHGNNYDMVCYDGDDFYYYMCRIDDTFICATTMVGSTADKGTIQKTIKALGY